MSFLLIRRIVRKQNIGGTMKQLENFVKVFAIIVLGYILIFGIMFPAHSDVAYSIGGDPQKIVDNVNVAIPATMSNCKPISKYVFHIMRRYQYSELKLVGVWTNTRGHMFVSYKNAWGDTMVITTGRTNKVMSTRIVRVKSIEAFCSSWDKDWTYYFVYTKDDRVYTKRIRQ